MKNKKFIAAVATILVFLAVLIPFASSNPDGLEKVAETVGVEEPEPVWGGIMNDYNAAIAGNPYLSTLLAGIFGTLIVLVSMLLLGKALASKKPSGASGETSAQPAES